MLSLPLLLLATQLYFCYHQLSRVLITLYFVQKQISPRVFLTLVTNVILL